MSGDIERTIAEIESAADPATRERVRALVSAVLELHAGALARLCALSGPERVRELAADPSVAGVLLLHGLHPDPIEARARAALDEAAEVLARRQVVAELVDAAGGRLRVLVSRTGGGACGGAVISEIEARLLAAAPDAESIAVDDAAALVSITRRAGGR
ncbi:MAG TPA: hypothetical protein VIG06_27420 [Kofleriaceae bacterium]